MFGGGGDTGGDTGGGDDGDTGGDDGDTGGGDDDGDGSGGGVVLIGDPPGGNGDGGDGDGDGGDDDDDDTTILPDWLDDAVRTLGTLKTAAALKKEAELRAENNRKSATLDKELSKSLLAQLKTYQDALKLIYADQEMLAQTPVSYTHLTLPTICSV